MYKGLNTHVRCKIGKGHLAMALCLLYYSIMAVMYFVAARNRQKFDIGGSVNKALTLIMYIIVFVMGIRMGSNEEVTSKLGAIGLQSVFISVLTIVLSMLFVTIMRKIMKIDRYGSRLSETVDSKELGLGAEQTEAAEAAAKAEAAAAAEKNKENLKTTLLIAVDVFISMSVGYFLRPMLEGSYEAFDSLSSNAIVVGLCFLTGLVGFSLGLDGTVFHRIREAGSKVLLVPLLMISGTVAAGVIFAFASPFEMKEAVAISLGFGWYTYAPGIITEAGYVMAGAVSFLHNVIRETAGIILIPFIAQKIGYIEATTVPGIAAMDICMPIIERSCRSETIVYGLSNGLCASFACSLLVPIVISL